MNPALLTALLIAQPVAPPGLRPSEPPNRLPQGIVPAEPLPSGLPGEPGRLPPRWTLPPGYQMAEESPRPTAANANPSIRLPQPENLLRVDANRLMLRSFGTSWQLWAGSAMLRDLGGKQREGQELLGVVRDIQPTHWASIGAPRPIVEYGLQRGEATLARVFGRTQIPIDAATLKTEAVRGAWVVSDQANLLLNFAADRAGAEQAVAVIRRYGFNRLVPVGSPTILTQVLIYSQDAAPAAPTSPEQGKLQRALQTASITRAALDVPGVGLVGERIYLDRALLQVQREAGHWAIVQQGETIASFGSDGEFAARDVLRTIIDARYTEMGRIGSLSFFLTNGQPPTRVPFGVSIRPLEIGRLRAASVNGRWGLVDALGRPLFTANSQEEAELMLRVIQSYGFDAIAQIGSNPRTMLRFVTKSGR